MKTTYLEFNGFVGVASQYMREIKKRSKLTYAIEQIFKAGQKHLDKFQTELTKIAVKYAIEKDGALLTEPNGNFKFSREDIIKRNQEQKVVGETEIEVKEFIVPLPENLSVFYQLAFEGFILSIQEEPKD